MAVKIKSKKNKQSEFLVHTSIVEHFNLRKIKPYYTIHHSPNGGHRNPREGAKFNKMGTKPGYPDIEILADGESLFIEVKSASGRISTNQLNFHEILRKNGFQVETVSNIDDAIYFMLEWGLIK